MVARTKRRMPAFASRHAAGLTGRLALSVVNSQVAQIKAEGSQGSKPGLLSALSPVPYVKCTYQMYYDIILINRGGKGFEPAGASDLGVVILTCHPDVECVGSCCFDAGCAYLLLLTTCLGCCLSPLHGTCEGLMSCCHSTPAQTVCSKTQSTLIRPQGATLTSQAAHPVGVVLASARHVPLYV